MRTVISRTAIASLFLIVCGWAGTASAQGKVCKLEITGNDVMQFDKKELKVAGDCTQVALTLKHSGKLPANVMGHNWVLTETKDADAVMKAGLTAGLKNGYLPPGDKRIIANTKTIGGGETTSITFPTSRLKKGGDYKFFCSYAGHGLVMTGKFIFG